MMNNKGRLTSQQLRILGLAWIGITILVGACVFFGLFIALRGPQGSQASISDSTSDGTPEATATVDTVDPSDLGTQSPGPATQPTPTIPPRQDTSFGYGIQIQAHVNTEQTLDQVQQLGMGWIKQQISWKDLEPVEGQANWDALDSIFAATSARNIRVLVSLTNAPDWARSVTAEGKHGPPDDPQDFVNYVSQMLQRYPGAIHAVEVWNEPNLADRGWYAPGGLNAQSYMDLLIPTAQAIREIDPNIIVISAALAPTGWNDGVVAIDDFVYMQQMIDVGLLDHVDCVGAHANGINLPPDVAYDANYQDSTAVFLGPFTNPSHDWSFYSTLTGYNNLIVAAGKNTPLCVTEFGWASVEGMIGAPPGGFEFAFDNSLQEQADYIVEAFQLMHEWDFVWLAFLFNLDYSPKNGGDPLKDSTMWSITAPDGSPRPSFDAVRAMDKLP